MQVDSRDAKRADHLREIDRIVWVVLRLLTQGLLFTSIAGVGQPVSAAESSLEERAVRLVREGLARGRAHELLRDLCNRAGHRLSGSPGAEKAVVWSKETMESLGLEHVRLEPVEVPHWVRGDVELAAYRHSHGEPSEGLGRPVSLSVCALGGSVGTTGEGITAKVLQVRSFEDLRSAGPRAKGKIIFFNRAFDKGQYSAFAMYGGAVNQRTSGAIEAARAGGVAAVVRSMTSRIDDKPHTGAMRYAEGIPRIPAAAISTLGAEALSQALSRDPHLELSLKLSCEILPDVMSSNVMGEITGTEKPTEVVVIGGHLDSWDKGQGAHDDGAGCIHSIEALRLLKELGMRPKRTIRAVMFMNEENGNRGGIAYAATSRPGETHIAAIESDSGGFTPRGFGVGGGTKVFEAVSRWAPLFARFDAGRFLPGGGGTDIGPLGAKGVALFGLTVDDHRYFDYHHSDNDTIEAVNERELELGAIAMALMSYLIAEHGLPLDGK